MKIINLKNYKSIELKDDIIIINDIEIFENANYYIFIDESGNHFNYKGLVTQLKIIENKILQNNMK